jgi:hypothetical protein
MSLNPFAGTDLEQPFQEGFAVGFMSPDTDNTPPSPFSLDAQDAYAKGVTSGVDATHGMRVPPSVPPEKSGTWEDLAHFGEIGVDVTHTLIEMSGAAAKTGIALAGALEIFVSVAIFGPNRSEPFFEDAAALGMRRVADQLRANGVVTDNIDLFMAACDHADHDPDTGDELTRQGFFHGNVFLNFDSAANQGRAHVHAADTRVLHFQTATPDIIELIDLRE